MKSLGLAEIFDPKNSDMKGVALDVDLPLGQVFQNARIKVGEFGIGEILNNGKWNATLLITRGSNLYFFATLYCSCLGFNGLLALSTKEEGNKRVSVVSEL